MMLLAPALAGFAALVGVPLLIHLLNRRKFRVVRWAAMEFLLATMQKNARRIQLRDVILLALRMLAVAALALALARPSIPPGSWVPGAAGETAAVLVLDASASMQAREGAATRFDQAKSRAREALELLPAGAAAALLLAADTPRAELATPSRDRSAVAAAIDGAHCLDGTSDPAAALNAALDLLDRSPSRAREIYLVSDFQATGWPESSDPRLASAVARLKAADPPVRLYLVDAGSGLLANASIDQLIVEDAVATTDAPVTVSATIRTFGRSLDRVAVECWTAGPADAELRKTSTHLVERVDGSARVEVSLRLTTGGRHRVELRLPPDRYEADDRARCTVEVLDRLPVLLVEGRPAVGEGPFAGATGFLRAALAPADPDQALVTTGMTVESVPVAALSTRRLRDSRVVVLADVADLPPEQIESLAAWVRGDGGGLVVVAGPRTRSDGLVAALMAKGLLPATVGTPLDFPGEGLGLSTTDLAHPVVAPFRDQDQRPLLAKVRVTKAVALDPVAEQDLPAGDHTAVVLRLADGRPLALERRTGRGCVLLVGTTLDRTWNDLPLRPVFVPLVTRLMQHAALSSTPPSTVRVQQPLIDLMPIDAPGQVQVTDPNGKVRTLGALPTARGDALELRLQPVDVAGFWRLESTGRAARWGAANPPASESDPACLGSDALAGRLPGATWVGVDGLRSAVEHGRVGIELWPLLLALVVLALAAESCLAVRWAPQEAT